VVTLCELQLCVYGYVCVHVYVCILCVWNYVWYPVVLLMHYFREFYLPFKELTARHYFF